MTSLYYHFYLDGLVQEKRISIANAMELRLSCTNPSICGCPDVISLSFYILYPGLGAQLHQFVYTVQAVIDWVGNHKL